MKFLQCNRRSPGRGAIRVLFWWTFIRGILRWSFRLLYGLRLSGASHVPESGPVIFVSNHQSHLDPMAVGVLVGDRPFAGFARATLFRPGFMNWMMHSIGTVPVRRGASDTGAMKAALRELEEGRCLAIFPEGTRTRDGAMGPFLKGVALIIRRSGAPVVPVAVEGAFDIWRHGQSKPKLSGRMALCAAEPIPAEEVLADGVEAGIERLKRQIDAMRLELRADMRRRSGGRYPAPGPADAPYWQTAPTAES